MKARVSIAGLVLGLLAGAPAARASAPDLGVLIVDGTHFDGPSVLTTLCGSASCAGVTYLNCNASGCVEQASPTSLGSHATNVASVLAKWLHDNQAGGDKPVRLYSANGAGAFAWLAQAEGSQSRAQARGVEVVIDTLGSAAEQSCPTNDPTYAYLSSQGVKIFWASGNNTRNGFVRAVDGLLAQRVISCDQSVVSVGNLYSANVSSGGDVCTESNGPKGGTSCTLYPMHWKSNYKPGFVPLAANGCLPELLGGTQGCTTGPTPLPGQSGEIGTSFSAPAVAAGVAAISRRSRAGSHDAYQRLVAASAPESFTIQTSGAFNGQQVSYRRVTQGAVATALAGVSVVPDAFEDDDTRQTYRALYEGIPHQHNFSEPFDPDWTAYAVTGGIRSRVTLSGPVAAQAALTLYRQTDYPNGPISQVAAASNQPNQQLQVTNDSPAGGSITVYYVEARPTGATIFGASTAYTLAVTTEQLQQPPDEYEPDNEQAAYTALYAGAPQAHNFHDLQDQDWVAYAVSGGYTSHVQLEGSAAAAAQLEMYRHVNYPNGPVVLVATGANSATGTLTVTHLAPANESLGVYYVRASPTGAAGVGTTFVLSVTVD